MGEFRALAEPGGGDGAETLWGIAEAVPPEWYGGDPALMERLMERLLEARSGCES